MHYAQLHQDFLSEAALMGWLDFFLFCTAVTTWLAGAPVWVPVVFFIAAVVLLYLILGDAEGLGSAIGEFLGNLW